MSASFKLAASRQGFGLDNIITLYPKINKDLGLSYPSPILIATQQSDTNAAQMLARQRKLDLHGVMT